MVGKTFLDSEWLLGENRVDEYDDTSQPTRMCNSHYTSKINNINFSMSIEFLVSGGSYGGQRTAYTYKNFCI